MNHDYSIQGQVLVASRDPEDSDVPHFPLWWNMKKNRFFMYQGINAGRAIWEHLKEIEDDK